MRSISTRGFVKARLRVPRKRRRFSRRAQLNRRTGGFVGIELKFFDSGITATAIATSADATGAEIDPTTVDCLNSMVIGNTQNTRIGRKVNMKKISIRGVVAIPVQVNITSLDTLPLVFIAIVLDKQTNASQLNSEDVYDNISGSGATNTSMFRKLEQSDRFRILASEQIEFHNTPQVTYDGTNIEATGQFMPFEFHVDLKGMTCLFKANAGIVADIVDNSIHVLAWVNSSTYAATLAYNARLRFTG